MERTRASAEQLLRVRELEQQIEKMEDDLDEIGDGEQPNKRRRLQERITNLRNKLGWLDLPN